MVETKMKGMEPHGPCRMPQDGRIWRDVTWRSTIVVCRGLVVPNFLGADFARDDACRAGVCQGISFQFGLKGFDGGFAILGAIGMKALAGSNAGALYADADPPTDFVCVKVLVECTHLGDFVG